MYLANIMHIVHVTVILTIENCQGRTIHIPYIPYLAHCNCHHKTVKEEQRICLANIMHFVTVILTIEYCQGIAT